MTLKKDKPLGQLLVDNHVISEEELSLALERKKERTEKYLGEILVEIGVSQTRINKALDLYKKRESLEDVMIAAQLLTVKQVQKIKEEQAQEQQSLVEVLIAKGYLSHEEYLVALSRHANLPIVSLHNRVIHPSARNVINEEYAKNNRIAVFEDTEEKTKIAICEPDMLLIEELQKYWSNHKEIEFYLAKPDDLDAYIANLYGDHKAEYKSNGSGKTKKPANGEPSQPSDQSQSQTLSLDESLQHDRRTLQLMDYIFNTAIKQGASDIHLEAKELGGVVKIRVDGKLRLLTMPDDFRREYVSTVSRIKILTRSMKIDEKVMPQDGSFRGKYKFDNKQKIVDFRVSTVCSKYGENVVIRILDQDKARVTLAELGFSVDVYERFNRLISKPEGMILVTGPTGSGKSTTLYAALNSLTDPTKKIITVEDPIEYTYEDIVQTQINRARGVDFSSLLRAFLRQDPDVIMVGEIRDPETAYMSIKAVQTGHLLLSTLHTVNTTKTVGRIRELQIDPKIFLSYTAGIMGQRLVRTICPRCAVETRPDSKKLQQLFGRPKVDLKFMEGKGCESCQGEGYSGRTAVNELWVVSAEELSTIPDYDSESLLRQHAVEHGLKSFYMDGLSKIISGSTSVDEIMNSLPTLEDDRRLHGSMINDWLNDEIEKQQSKTREVAISA